MRIAVIHDYADVFRTARTYPQLAAHQVVVYTDAYKDPDKTVTQVSGCDAVVLTNERVPFPRQVIEQLPELKLICQTSVKTGHIDVGACTERGILVAVGRHAANSGFLGTAELTWGLIIASLRNLPYEVQRLKQGYWQSTVGTRLFGSTLGIYAYGNIGAAVAQVGHAFGMKVVCWGREGSTARARADGFEVAASRQAFFENADVLTLHLRLNKETRGIVTGDDLARMKPTALLVNTSRAAIIAAGDLVAALQNGRPGHAAVDVYEEEPVVDADHPLVKMPNTLCTPHLGYAEHNSYGDKYLIAIEQLLEYASGKSIDVINPDALRKRQLNAASPK